MADSLLPAASSSHPPRPRLALRVGVTGHRWGASLDTASAPRIERQFGEILDRCATVAEAILGDNHDVFAAAPPQLIALSCMAAGGDQMFASIALERGWRLEAVLPFAAEEYVRDFDTEAERTNFRALLGRAASVFEIADPRSDEDASEAYETAGLTMLDHVDLLVALWDGGESRGRGGTREILDEALRRGIPSVWIDSTADRAPAIWDGKALARLPDGAVQQQTAATAKLDALLTRTLQPPGAGDDPTEVEAGRRLRRFLRETEKQPPWWAAGYDLMLRLTVKRPFKFPIRLSPIASRRGEWDGFIGDLPPNGPLEADIREELLVRYLWADHVADRLSRAYRGAYILNFTLAAAAVFGGLLGLFYWDSILMKTVCAIIEFTMIALILAITREGARGSWHARFLDARRLAELLRHTRVLAPLARTGRDASGSEPGERWTAWYAQAARRELTLPRARVDSAYLAAVVRATVEHEVKPQIAYHANNHKRLHHLHHALDHVGERLFYLTGVLCVVWIICAIIYSTNMLGQAWIKYGVKPLLTFLGAVLPAVGAALAGIRAQGDFTASAQRSHATEQELEALREQVEHAVPASYREACLWQTWVADAMASEIGSWRSLYANRPLTIPG